LNDHSGQQVQKAVANAECLSKAIRDHLIKIGLAARHTKTLSMHGLRKTMARDSAFAGNTIEEVQSQGGWKTAKMAAYYVGQAGRKRRNAEAVARLDAYDAQRKAMRVQVKRAGLKVVMWRCARCLFGSTERRGTIRKRLRRSGFLGSFPKFPNSPPK
jgi:hypothetical protein